MTEANIIKKQKKLIHLLYVPTMFCNLGCQYCYLGEQTTAKKEWSNPIETLTYSLEKFQQADVLPFNVSLHGGEVTTLSSEILGELFRLIRTHYLENFDALAAKGFKKIYPHIKTNLYNFHKLYDLMVEHKVSVSASVDIPLFLHEKYRTTKQGNSSLDRIVQNLRLLGGYPHYKKISSTLYPEHIENSNQLIDDIWHIHKEIGFDMNQFNFMFGFETALNDGKFPDRSKNDLKTLSDEKQVAFYETMKKAFMGTELEYGLRRNWFDEFYPSYCTNALNCGERFFLLQGDGNIYGCVRGQGVEPFHYGNIFENSVEEILNNGKRKIATVHQKYGIEDSCKECEYIHICHTGCAFVKDQLKTGKSYACALQKAIYRDNPASYPPANSKEQQELLAEEYILNMHPNLKIEERKSSKITNDKLKSFVLPSDLYDPKNGLQAMIAEDPILQALYSSDTMILELNGKSSALTSQILDPTRTLFNIFEGDSCRLHLARSLFHENCREVVRNTVYLQMLRDTTVVYGDEQRTKQEHTFTHQIFYNMLEESPLYGEEYVMVDLMDLFRLHKRTFLKNVLNNFFVTTGVLRDYHYQKQRSNGFYHIQAMNLPFQNIEFYWT